MLTKQPKPHLLAAMRRAALKLKRSNPSLANASVECEKHDLELMINRTTHAVWSKCKNCKGKWEH